MYEYIAEVTCKSSVVDFLRETVPSFDGKLSESVPGSEDLVTLTFQFELLDKMLKFLEKIVDNPGIKDAFWYRRPKQDTPDLYS